MKIGHKGIHVFIGYAHVRTQILFQFGHYMDFGQDRFPPVKILTIYQENLLPPAVNSQRKIFITMVLGHFGVGLGAKRFAPKISLGTLFIAVQWADLLW